MRLRGQGSSGGGGVRGWRGERVAKRCQKVQELGLSREIFKVNEQARAEGCVRSMSRQGQRDGNDPRSGMSGCVTKRELSSEWGE